jgi:hypothetical protein
MAKKPKVAQAILLACALITSLNVAIPAPAKAAADCGVTGITSGGKVYYIFKNVGVCEWTKPAGVTSAEYLLVGGGGGGGGGRGGGGGGGGVMTGTWNSLNEYSAFNIWVGSGGSGSSSSQRGVNGGWSAIVPPDSGVPGLYLWAGGGGGGGSGSTNGSISYGGNADALAGASISQVRGSGGGAGFNFAISPTRYWSLGGTGANNGGNTYLCTTGDVYHDTNRSTGGGGGAGANANGGGFGTAGDSLPTQCGFLSPPFETVFASGFFGNSNGGSGKTNSLMNQIGPIANITGSYAGSPTFSYFFGGGGGGSDGRGSFETCCNANGQNFNALGAGNPGDGGGGYGQIKQSGPADYFSAGKANTGGGGGGGLGTGAAGGSGLVVLVVTKSTPTISYASSLKSAMLKKRNAYTLPAASAPNGLGVTLTSATNSVCTIRGNDVTFVADGTCAITASSTASDGFYAASRSDSITIINNNTQNVQSVKLVDPQLTGTQKVNLARPNIRDPYSGTYEVHTCVDVVSGPASTSGNVATMSDVLVGINGSYDASKVTSISGGLRINASKSLTDTYLGNLYIQAVGSTKLTRVNNSSLYILIRSNLIADAATDALEAYCDDENKNWVQIKSSDRIRSRTNISVSRPVRR